MPSDSSEAGSATTIFRKGRPCRSRSCRRESRMIFTFYSYKGGVGRSMALANVAESLHEKGLRVVMIDWDLEAPGLETFFCPPGSEKQLAELRAHPGLIDMIMAYTNAYPGFSAQRLKASTV